MSFGCMEGWRLDGWLLTLQCTDARQSLRTLLWQCATINIRASLQLFVGSMVSCCCDVTIITWLMQLQSPQWKQKPDEGFGAVNSRQWNRSDGKCLTDKWREIKKILHKFILITQDINNNPFPVVNPFCHWNFTSSQKQEAASNFTLDEAERNSSRVNM